VYLSTIQSCLYRAVPPFGPYGSNRKDAIQEYSKQLYIIADLMDDGAGKGSSYMCGTDVSLADATVFPSIVFASYMFPKFDHGISDKPPIPVKIQKWYQHMIDTDIAFQKVYEEVSPKRELFC
jgi:glutathione S-transferase